MSTERGSRTRLRNALRQQEAMVAQHKTWRRISALGSVWSLAVIALWFITIRWGIASIGVYDVGGAVFFALVGLTVVTIVSVAGVGTAFEMTLKAREQVQRAKWEYEDAVLEDGGML